MTPSIVDKMNFKFKVRRFNYEDGEFTDYVNVDKMTIEKVFSNNYDVDDSLKSFRTIAITDDRQQTIVVHYIKRGVCDIYYIPLDSDFYYFKKSTIELATQAVGLFLENKMSDLTLLLNKRTEDNNFIRGDFFNKSFDFRVTTARSLREISWIGYALPLGLAFIILGIINFRPSSILLFIVGLVLWLPGVIIHYQYYMDNHQLCVTLSKGNDNIIVTTSTHSKIFKKGDIKDILKVDSGFNRFAWGLYGFTRIEFKTGEILNLTSLMLEQLLIEDKFVEFHGKVLKGKTLIPTLKKKTRL